MSARLARRWQIFRRPLVPGEFARAVNFSIDTTDAAIGALEDRVSAIEAVLAARWPRRMFLRRQLARELRASAATFAWAGETFRARRAEAMSEDIVNRGKP